MCVTLGEVIDGITVAFSIISLLMFIRLYKIFASNMTKVRLLINSIDNILVNRGKYNSNILAKKLRLEK